MKPYCYWSLATGPYAALMERCVASARACGVFTDFHVLTDRPIPDCECYDAFDVEKESGLFRFYYLKAGIAKLSYDHYVWLDADTLFRRKPNGLLDCLGASPIHVPLTRNLEDVPAGEENSDPTLMNARDALHREGISNDACTGSAAFWIVKRDAVDALFDLAVGFYQKSKEAGTPVHAATALGYAMQMLCANPDAHLQQRWAALWGEPENEQSAILHLNQTCRRGL